MSLRRFRFGLPLALVAAVCAGAYAGGQTSLRGLIIREPHEVAWKNIDAADVLSGATIPPDSNVVFHLPETGFAKIHREVLFGHRGKRVRYWGYCFEQNDEPEVVERRTGLPGLVFLSEAEQAEQQRIYLRDAPRFTLGRLPTREELREPERVVGSIRHQIEFFQPGMLCYIQTADILPIGLDTDHDKINNKLEGQLETDPEKADTDADGISDGIEYLYKTDPLTRDTDGDKLLDGIEDENWNGRINRDETDPRIRDSDRDGLCDGWCRVKLRRTNIFMGEDRNLNGNWDQGETSPLLVDSDGDRIRDDQEFINCLSAGGADCPN